jgi:Phage integrase central domain
MGMVSTSSWPARHRGTGPIGIGSRARNAGTDWAPQDLSLKDARIKRDAARQEVRAGVDIVQTKRLAREGARAEAAVAAASTFKECAEKYIKDNEAKWSKKHAAQWPSSLKQYAYPTIGDLRIAEILPSHIFELLKPIWIEKRETSKPD